MTMAFLPCVLFLFLLPVRDILARQKKVEDDDLKRPNLEIEIVHFPEHRLLVWCLIEEDYGFLLHGTE